MMSTAEDLSLPRSPSKETELEILGRSLAWRWLSFVVGVVVPSIVWGAVFAFCELDHQGTPFKVGLVLWLSYAIVILEVVTLVRWLRSEHTSPKSERTACAVFVLGSVFAGYWSLWSSIGIYAMATGAAPMWVPLLLVMISPFPCGLVYLINARIAFRLARSVPRSDLGVARRRD